MDCETFFATVDAHLGTHWEQPTRTATGDQCVVDFFHPRVIERFGAEGLGTQFNRSGIVWVPRAERLSVQLRVPETHAGAVTEALAGTPLSVDRTDHRGVPVDGTVVTVLHYAMQATGVSRDTLDETLSALAVALSV